MLVIYVGYSTSVKHKIAFIIIKNTLHIYFVALFLSEKYVYAMIITNKITFCSSGTILAAQGK